MQPLLLLAHKLPSGERCARTRVPAQHARRDHARQERASRQVGTQRTQHDWEVPMAAAEGGGDEFSLSKRAR